MALWVANTDLSFSVEWTILKAFLWKGITSVGLFFLVRSTNGVVVVAAVVIATGNTSDVVVAAVVVVVVVSDAFDFSSDYSSKSFSLMYAKEM